jgi:hypothetical protein
LVMLVRLLNLKFLQWTLGETDRNFKVAALVVALVGFTLMSS